MNTSIGARPRVGSVRPELVAAAVALALLSAAAARAQTIPFQSSARQTFGTGLGQEALPRGGVFRPRVETAVQYVDNINTASKGEKQVDTWGLELAPGFYAAYSSSSVTAAIDYSVIGRVWDDSDYDNVSQQGAANGRWIAVPDLFYIDAQGSITDNVISPLLGTNYGGLGLFGADNLTQQAALGVTPTFDRRFGEFNLLAQYSYGRVWYFDEGDNANQVGFLAQDDSRNQGAYVSYGNTESGRKLTGDVFYEWQKTDYDNALPYEYEQVGADVAWQFTPSTALVGRFGIESDLEKSTSEGGLDSNFWDVGLRWEPDDRTYAEARYGSRFFGDTYYLNARRTARMFEFWATYSESPEVEDQMLSLGDFNPGELPPGVPDFNTGSINSDPYVGKNASAGIAAIGSRTRISLTGYQNVQDYISNAQNDDTTTGGRFEVTRQLASNLSADFWVSYEDYETNRDLGNPPVNFKQSSYDTTLIARLNRTSSGEKLTTTFETGYLNSAGFDAYDGWWVGLRVRWRP